MYRSSAGSTRDASQPPEKGSRFSMLQYPVRACCRRSLFIPTGIRGSCLLSSAESHHWFEKLSPNPGLHGGI